MCLEIGTEPLPDQAVSALASALKPLEPQPCGLEVHLLKAPAVAVHSEVQEMPSQSSAERGVLVRKLQVPVAPTPFAEGAVVRRLHIAEALSYRRVVPGRG